jgi:hypothetical protein
MIKKALEEPQGPSLPNNGASRLKVQASHTKGSLKAEGASRLSRICRHRIHHQQGKHM